jgi:hypothetical protein
MQRASGLPTIAQHKSTRKHGNKWIHIKARQRKLTMVLKKTGRCSLQVFKQEVLCLFLEWNGYVMCCILTTFISSNIFFFATMKEIEVSRKGKELDFSQGREESLEVRYFAL